MGRNFIYEARKLAGLSQEDVAKKLGMEQSTYSTKERANDFTSVQRKKLYDIIGRGNISEVLDSANLVNEPGEQYGEESPIKQVLIQVNRLLKTQKLFGELLAEILASIKKEPVENIIKRLHDYK